MAEILLHTRGIVCLIAVPPSKLARQLWTLSGLILSEKEMFSTISCIYIETQNRIAQENLTLFLQKLLRFSYCAISYELLCLFGNFLPRVLNLVQEHISSFYQNPLTILDILQWGIKEDKIRGEMLFTMNKEATQWSFQETNLKSSALFTCYMFKKNEYGNHALSTSFDKYIWHCLWMPMQ